MLILFATVFSINVSVYAEDSTSSAEGSSDPVKKYNIVFPIVDLGGCSSLSECKAYCSNSQNKVACINYSKSKGFYKTLSPALKNSIVNAAKLELGCDSEDSCRKFCSEQENWQKCGDFAKRHNIGTSKTKEVPSQNIINQAKDLLGCSSLDSCKNFCTKVENKQKCDEFAQLVGLRSIQSERLAKELEDSSSSAMILNPEKLRQMIYQKICEGNPQICDSIKKSNPKISECISEGKFWNGKDCSEKDPNFQINEAEQRQKIEQYCRLKGGVCQSATGDCKCINFNNPYPATPSPVVVYPQSIEDKCKNYGCSWENNSCFCNGRVIYPPSTASATVKSLPAESICKPPANGCEKYNYWDNKKCECRSYEDFCQSKSGCVWKDNSCNCQISPPDITDVNTSVKGVSTIRNFIQRFFDNFK